MEKYRFAPSPSGMNACASVDAWLGVQVAFFTLAAFPFETFAALALGNAPDAGFQKIGSTLVFGNLLSQFYLFLRQFLDHLVLLHFQAFQLVVFGNTRVKNVFLLVLFRSNALAFSHYLLLQHVDLLRPALPCFGILLQIFVTQHKLVERPRREQEHELVEIRIPFRSLVNHLAILLFQHRQAAIQRLTTLFKHS